MTTTAKGVIQMETNEIYVYLVKEGNVVQEVWNCTEKSSGAYYIKTGKKQRQIVYKSSLDQCERNRIVSFKDDLPHFRQVIIDEMEARIKEAAERLKIQRKILKSIKNNQ